MICYYFDICYFLLKSFLKYRIQLCIIRKNTQPAPRLLTPKSWKKWISDILTAPQIQHSKGPCVSSPKQKAYLANTLFFTHDVLTSSNYAYLSLQTNQLSAISAVIGNMFTIVKLQYKVTLCAHVVKTSLQAREATQKYYFRGRKPCCSK